MGYTHYLYRPAVIPKQTMRRIVAEFKKLLPELEKAGCKLAGGDGTGAPVIAEEEVLFNGPKDCGHPENAEVVIPWPSEDAGGIACPGEDAKRGQWFAGAVLQKRTCNGDCSYETFAFKRVRKAEYAGEEAKENGLWFDFCKTAFRPYDLAVICFLVIAKHHLKGRIKVSSDGTDAQWFDGKLFCQMHLGYGLDCRVTDDGELVPEAQADVAAAGNDGR